MKGVLAFLPIVTVLLHGQAWADALIVRADSTPLLAEPKLKADVVATLASGERLEGLERSGLFWRARGPSGVEGYVVVSKVQAPQTGTAKLKGVLRSVLSEKQSADGESPRLRSKNAVMGIRGLSGGDDLSSVSNLRPNLSELERLEALNVKPSQVRKLQAAVLKEADARSGSLSTGGGSEPE
jgi:hypothetical protein